MQRTEKTTRPREATTRIGMDVNEMLLLHHYQPLMAEAIAKFPSEPWVELGAEVGVPLQPLRSPEEALHDPAFLADGCVIEVDDPELGAGAPGRAGLRPPRVPDRRTHRAAARRGAHRRRARRSRRARRCAPPRRAATHRGAAHRRSRACACVDLGLAVAGPWGTMMLADLGAEVIKVNPLHDFYWMSTHIAMACNRGKRSIAHRTSRTPRRWRSSTSSSRTADIVQHNMRYDAAVRLGVDYESLRAIKPDLIYCHTRGFEHGRAERLPGNDQTGAALAGPDWLDGGLDHDGIPLWPVVSLGDTGNGFLSAIAMVQALYHRDRTGEGQFVDTSIMYAQLLNVSIAWSLADGQPARRPPESRRDAARVPRDATALRDGRRLALRRRVTDEQRSALGVGARRRQGRPTATAFAASRNRRSAPAARRSGSRALDAAGVPCEVSSPDFVLGLFDDPEMIEKGWVTKYRHPIVGDMDAVRPALRLLPRRPGVVQGHRSCPARTPVRSSASWATTTTASTSSRGQGDPRLEAADVPSVIPPVAHARRPVLLGRDRRGPARVPALRGVRRRAAPDRHRCAASATRSSGTRRSRPGTGPLHLDRVAPPHQARRRAAGRGAGRARRGHPLRVEPARRRRPTSVQNGMEVDAEHRGGRRRRPPPVPACGRRGRVMALSRETADRRHRPDRVLQALRPQRAPARGRSRRAAIADAGSHRPTSTAWSRSPWTSTTSSR